MGVLGVWYNNFFGAQSHALLPYDQVQYACNDIPSRPTTSVGGTLEFTG